MDEATRRLLALSTEQQDLVTRAQLFTIGLTKRQIDHAIDTERLTLVHRTVRMGGSAITADSALAVGLLLTGALLPIAVQRTCSVSSTQLRANPRSVSGRGNPSGPLA